MTRNKGMSLTGRVALITGGTGALGRAVTAAFVQAGALAAVTYILDREVPECKACLGARADAPVFLKADVTVENQVQELVKGGVGGRGRIDILLHLEGGYVGERLVAGLPEAPWDHMLNVNLKSAFLCCKHVVPVMQRQGGASLAPERP